MAELKTEVENMGAPQMNRSARKFLKADLMG